MDQGQKEGAGLVEVTFLITLVALFSAVTVPQFFAFVDAQKEREARATLLDFYTSARAHFLDRGTYACGTCGVRPPADARFTYDFGDGRARKGSLHSDVCFRRAAARQGASGYRAVASAALDGGRRCSVWSIDEAMRLVAGGEGDGRAAP